jgi:hypothetical protein
VQAWVERRPPVWVALYRTRSLATNGMMRQIDRAAKTAFGPRLDECSLSHRSGDNGRSYFALARWPCSCLPARPKSFAESP